MKKTLYTAALLISTAVAFADGFSTDFSEGQSDWVSGQWNGWNTPHFTYGENGAVVKHPWKQNTLSKEYTLDPSASSYSISFGTYATTNNQQVLFYLSSSTSDYSVLVGNSYNDNANVHVGYLNQDVIEKTSNTTVEGATFISFQSGSNRAVATLFGADAISSGVSVGGNLSYTLTLSGTDLTVSVTDANSGQWSYAATIASGVTFDTIGFIVDGNADANENTSTVGVKNISVASTPAVPEPATATLSLLALAGLCARRRRK